MAGSSSENIVVYPQLREGTNFGHWKFRILLILEENRIKEAIDPVPVGKELDKDKDAKAKFTIVKSINDKYISYVQKATTKEMLTCLENIFE